MKKIITAFILAVMTVCAAGCETETVQINTSSKPAVSSSAEGSDSQEDAKTDKNDSPDNESFESDEDPGEKGDDTSSSDAPLNENDNGSSAGSGEDEASEEEIEAELTAVAEDLYPRAVQMYFGLFCGCPYELDSTQDIDGYYLITDPSISSADDIIASYKTVFADSSELETSKKYIDIDGKPYCRDGARGSSIYYKDTDLVYVSSTDTEAIFSAVAHYADPETGEEIPDTITRFSLVLTDEGWRVSEFHLPM